MFRVQREIRIDRPLREVVEVFEGVEGWCAWLSFMPRAHRIRGSLWEVGGIVSFTVKEGPIGLPFKVKIFEASPGKRVVWGSGTPGLKVRHGFEFHDEGGVARVVSWEEFRGPVSALLKLLGLPKRVDSVHERWLADLRTEVLHRANSRSAA